MNYPSQRELLKRDSIKMTWEEYASYLFDNTPLTKQQAHVVAGKLWDIPNKEVSQALGTSTSVISSQRFKLSLSREDGFTEPLRTEFVSPPVPGCVFRKVGELEYLNDEKTEFPTNSGSVSVFIEVSTDEYVVVKEEYSEYDSSYDKESPLFGKITYTTEEIIYSSYIDFLEESTHSPKNIKDGGPDRSGGLFESGKHLYN